MTEYYETLLRHIDKTREALGECRDLIRKHNIIVSIFCEGSSTVIKIGESVVEEIILEDEIIRVKYYNANKRKICEIKVRNVNDLKSILSKLMT